MSGRYATSLMKIVVGATSHPLPVSDGMHLHVWHLLRHLSDRHEIVLVSEPRAGSDISPHALAEICSSYRPATRPSRLADGRLLREASTLVSGRSKVVEQIRRSGLPAAIEAAVRDVEPDVVHLETGALATIADRLGPPVVLVPLDAGDLNAKAYTQYAGGAVQRWLSVREARRWKEFERSAYRRCDAVVVVGERDADDLAADVPGLDPIVIPNGVDAERFHPPTRRRERDVVLLHGAMDYPPNVDAAVFAATDVLPRLRIHRPDARLILAGRNPDERVLALAGDYVEVTGELPDLVPLLQSAAAYLCPMRLGSGIKNKLLEALACGCPTAATPLATNGMGIRPGRDVLVANDGEGLAAALSSILADPDGVGAQLASAGRARAEAMSWAETARAFESVYSDVIGRRS